MDHVVVDVEIQRGPEEFPEGWEATDKLGVACACLYERRGDRFRVYGPGDVADLRARLLGADRISGYNIWKFDFPVIWAVSRFDWDTSNVNAPAATALLPRTDDLLRRIWLALGLEPQEFSELHKGWGLDAVAGATLGRRKTGHGADAPRWFRDGDWARVVDYCLNDVALERDLVAFVDRYGFVVSPKDGTKLAVPQWRGRR